MSSLFIGPDAQPRCRWCGGAPEFLAYHDHEWGFPVADDRRLFEKISLEAFQSGLSWRTILAKREHFREAFAQFDPASVATYGPAEVEQLLNNPGIVRHRGKIEATVAAARAYLAIEAREGFAHFLWKHVDHQPINSGLTGLSQVPAHTPAALARLGRRRRTHCRDQRLWDQRDQRPCHRRRSASLPCTISRKGRDGL